MSLRKIKFIIIVNLICFVNIAFGTSVPKNSITIEILGALSDKIERDNSTFYWLPEDSELFYSEWMQVFPSEMGRKFVLTINSNKPVFIDLRKILNTGTSLTLFEPGDNILIDLTNSDVKLSGIGWEKLQMQLELKAMEQKKTFPKNLKLIDNLSFQDFLEWSNFLDESTKVSNNILKKYKSKISKRMFEHLKALWISNIEFKRIKEYGRLSENDIEGKKKIFFKTMFSKSATWLRKYTGKSDYIYSYEFIRQFVWVKNNFDFKGDVLNSVKRKLEYASLGEQIYSGETLHQFLAYLLTQSGIEDHNYETGLDEIEYLIQKFYSLPGFPQYKEYVKRFDRSIRAFRITKGSYGSDLILPDQFGNLISKNHFDGKLVIISFLDTSKRSIELVSALREVKRIFNDVNHVEFVNIYVINDRLLWNKQLKNSRFVLEGAVNLFTNGTDTKHRLLDYYNISEVPELNLKAFPQTFLMDDNWRFLHAGRYYVDRAQSTHMFYSVSPNETIPDPIGNRTRLVDMIKQELVLMKDGPYILHERDSLTVLNFDANKISVKYHSIDDDLGLYTHTDSYDKIFPLKLKEKLITESSEILNRPAKLFVLSDIEGNFTALRNLLQANNVIDENLNWIFGEGHLVFAGDMFDRGKQVTECLWLLYTLEESAKDAGGRLHFILGNHEIMNLQGDDRYVDIKYKEKLPLIGKTLIEIYGKDSELGRWLRTKHIIHKIGDLLFVHGGISPELNASSLSLEQLNTRARVFYSDSKAAKNDDLMIRTLYSPDNSPFWYRSYYQKDRFSKSNQQWITKAKESQIDSTLKKFAVNHIITGHTIVADTISQHYGGKVINTDTKHANGKSEGLLIEGQMFYRVDTEGRKILLFKE